MLIYDDKLNKINDDKLSSQIDNTINDVVNYINRNTDNKYSELLNKRKDNLITQLVDEDYYLCHDDHIIRTPVKLTSGGLAGHAVTKKNGDKRIFVNGIYFKKSQRKILRRLLIVRENNIDKHVLVHEIFHALTFATESKEIDNNYYDKMGLTIMMYNKNGLVENRMLCARGLTEGMTEWLTTNYLRDKPMNYHFQLEIANILAGGTDKSLLNALLSDSSLPFINYLIDLNNKNVSINAKDLIDIPSEGNISAKDQYILLKGSMEYVLAKAKENNTYEEERNRLERHLVLDDNTSSSFYKAFKEAKTHQKVLNRH